MKKTTGLGFCSVVSIYLSHSVDQSSRGVTVTYVYYWCSSFTSKDDLVHQYLMMVTDEAYSGLEASDTVGKDNGVVSRHREMALRAVRRPLVNRIQRKMYFSTVSSKFTHLFYNVTLAKT